MKKIKVCHIISSHKRYDTRVFKKECRSLAKEGYDVTLITIDGLATEVIDGVRIKSIDIMSGVVWLGPGQWIVDGRKKKSSDVSLLDRVRRELCTHKYILKDALKIDAEIYHVHEPVLLPLARKLKKTGKKVIFDSHEDNTALVMSIQFIPKVIRPLIYQIYKVYYNSKIRKFDCLISVTPHIVQKLRKVNKNTHMVSNFPILNKINNKQVEVSANLFGFAGGVTSQWNHETILEALESLAARYELMGVGPEPFLSNLKKFASWRKVNYRGLVPHNEVFENLSKCIACIALVDYSNNSDGKRGTIGNTKLFEYMMMGKPVICTDFVLWREIIDKWNCGIYIPPRDVKALKDAMQYLMNNPREAEKMGYNGRQAVVGEFNWLKEEEKLLSLYKELYVMPG